jgi:hypothetical protein
VGTPKRERQKANKLQRQIDEAKADRVASVKRNTLRWGLIAVLAVGAVVLIAWIGGAFSDDNDDDEPGGAPAAADLISTIDATTATTTALTGS